MNGNPLIDWCEQVAAPVLEAAAAGQPISFAAKQALLRLSEILASQGIDATSPEGLRLAPMWHR